MTNPTGLTQTSEPVTVPTPHGVFLMQAFGFADGSEHLALTALPAERQSQNRSQVNQAPLVRIHSECATGDIFGSYRCDCGPQLAQALKMMAEQGGLLIYMRNHEGRGIGLVNKLRAYTLQDAGQDTLDANLSLGLPADARDYTQAVVMIKELGIRELRLLTNNPAKAEAWRSWG